MLRLQLPPNLPAGAGRNAIAVKVEMELPGPPPPAELLPALALLSKWMGGKPQARAFLQLTRGQMRDLVRSLEGREVFEWANRPGEKIGWRAGELPGVSEHLEEPNAADGGKGGLGASRGEPSGGAAASTRKPASGTPMTVDGSEHYLAITLPSREHPSYPEVLDLIKANGFLAEPSNGKWWIRDRHKVLNFLAAHRTRLQDEFGARFTPNFEKNIGRIRSAEIVCSADEADGGYEVSLELHAGEASESEVRSALLSGRGYVETGSGIVLLDSSRVRLLGAAQAALAGAADAGLTTKLRRRLSPVQAVGLEPVLEKVSPGFAPPAAWKARSEALHRISRLEPPPLPESLAARMRPYQRVGAAWLWHLYRHRLGGILADEMGLGKTVQALALLAAIGRSSPSLVVSPASLLENWRREAVRFTPGLKLFVHHGENRLRDAGAAADCDLVITSYGTLRRDDALFAAIPFHAIVADEAQHIKNRASQNARSLRSLRADARFLLTGTPLENSLDDLRSLLEFLLPGYLEPVPSGARGEERAWFDERLRSQAAPFILRRTKAAVAAELPPKLEQVLWCELTPRQAALYREFQEKGERELDLLAGSGASESRMRLAVFTQLLRLRQICCDPRLVGAGGPEDSAKLESFRELFDQAADDGHRLLVFSQFTSLLALLRQELESQGAAYCYLDGSMPARARQAEVDRFQGSAEIPVFLLSLKAGGVGLNLTGADTVVHFDPWWNPAVEMQATDRAHRIGQTRVVTSYKLIAAGTVEEKVLGLQAAKRALLEGIFEASDAATSNLSLADLKELLR